MSKLNAPEINISIFGFLLNFVWEIWQLPLFKNVDRLTHFEATLHCTQAALGDVVILLIVFWIVALTVRSRHWIVYPTMMPVIGFIVIGIVFTVVFEAIAIHILDRWQYAAVMPSLPILGTGIAPLFQWLLIPPIIVSMLSRRVASV